VAFGGAEVYSLFIQYRDTCGWWNNDCTTEFGIDEFLGLWILFEANGNPEIASVISTIIAQNLYVGGYNPPPCQNQQTCFNAVFNFIGAYSGGRGGLFAGPTSRRAREFVLNRPQLGNNGDARSMMSSLGSQARNPNSVVLWDRYYGPSNWGNVSDWGKRLRRGEISEGTINGYASSTVYFYINNAIYFSKAQYEYWEALGVDMTLAEEGETIP
jgi:hypothetical protein